MDSNKFSRVVLFLAIFFSCVNSFGQVPHFTLSATTFQVRQHGQAEVVGDLTLTCDVPGTFPPSSAITVVYSPAFGIVNSVGGIFATASATGLNARIAPVESEPATTAIVLGTAALNTVVTDSITVAISGSAAINDIIRIAGIKLNIGEAHLPVNQSISGTITATPSNAFQIDNVSTVAVALVLDEVTVTVQAANALVICLPGACQMGIVTVSEKFPSALTSTADENSIQFKPTNGKPVLNGTQLAVLLSNIVPGVTVSWPTSVTNNTLTVTLPSNSPTSFTNTSATTPSSVTVTFNVTADSAVSLESISIPFTFCPSAIPIPPVFATTSVQVLLGPNAGVGFSSEQPVANLLSFVRNPLNSQADGIAQLVGVSCFSNLVVQGLQVNPNSGPPRSTVSVNFDIFNHGAGTASPSTTQIRLNTSNTAVTNQDLLLASLSSPIIPPGNTNPVNQRLTVPCNLSPGLYFVWVNLDVNQTAQQGSTNNNTANSPLTIVPAGCADPLGQGSQSFAAGGGTGSVSVKARLGCFWTASSDVSWITITSGSAGSGNGVVNFSVSSNPNATPRTGHLTVAGSLFLVAQAGNSLSGFSTTVNAGSGISKISSNSGSLAVSYAELSATVSPPPAAFTNFGLFQNGALISDVGVPAALPVTFTRMFVDLSGGNDSGVAIVNPGDAPITINVEARDSGGLITKGDEHASVFRSTLSLPPRGHLARFATQMGLNLPSSFSGILTLSSCTPFVAVNLRTAPNGHGESIFTALPLADLNSSSMASNLIFPQIVDGGGLPTQILLLNPSSNTTAVGTISLVGETGTALPLDFGSGPQSTLSYSIPPNGMVKFSTTGLGPVRVGYAVVLPSSGPLPVGSGIFTSKSSLGIASQAGVPNAPLTTSLRTFVETASSPLTRNTGVAIVNPNNATATLSLSLASFDGRVQTNFISVPPNGHLAKFLDELFLPVPPTFQGILTITSNMPIAALTLRLTKNERGEDIYSTLPTTDLNNPPLGALFLPQIAVGGGFQTQFILLSTSNNSGTVRLDFFDENGARIVLPLQ